LQGLQEAGLLDESNVRIALGFHGGIAGLQELCGAFTGGVMALSYQVGGQDREYKERKKMTDQAVRRLAHRFTEMAGDLHCRVITGLDFRDPEQFQAFRESVSKTKCRPMVEFVVKQVLTTKDEGGVLSNE